MRLFNPLHIDYFVKHQCNRIRVCSKLGSNIGPLKYILKTNALLTIHFKNQCSSNWAKLRVNPLKLVLVGAYYWAYAHAITMLFSTFRHINNFLGADKPILESLNLFYHESEGSEREGSPTQCSGDVLCLFCQEQFNATVQKEDLLRHLAVNHKFVIGDVNLITDLKK